MLLVASSTSNAQDTRSLTLAPGTKAEATETAPKRVALVIGNSDYKNTAKLENPKNDATDVAAALKKVGFQVIEGRDLDKAGMDRIIRDFAESLTGAKAGLLFYAGHGLQVGGQNYLVPTDARLTTAAALDFEMIRLDLIHRTMERETATNIIVLDACRDNPLARNLARAMGTRSTQIGRGLAPVESGEGTLISFSTQPGNVALDGTGRNSPFAGAFLKFMAEPGEDLPSILINVRNEVMSMTERRQVPWEHSALISKFYFIPPLMTVEQKLEATFWDAVKQSTTVAPIAGYLERYPNGANAALAKALIDRLEKEEEAERAARGAEQKRIEAEMKRLEEERKRAEAARVEASRRADEALAAAKAKTDRPSGAPGSDAAQAADRAERDRRFNEITEELQRARKAAEAAEAARLASQQEALDARKSAESAMAAAATEAKRSGETKLAALPNLDPKPLSPFDGFYIVRQVSNGSCLRATGSWRLQVRGSTATGYLEGVARKGTMSGNGSFRVESRDSSGTRALIYSGTLRGNSGSGSYRVEGTNCAGTFTVSRNQ